MATTIKSLKLRAPTGTRQMTVTTSNSKISVSSYATWTQYKETLYKFLFDDEYLYTNTNATVKVYKDGVYIQTMTITCTSGNDLDWVGSGTYDGLTITISASTLAYHDPFYCENTLYREDVLDDGEVDHDITNGARVYKVVVIDGDGSPTVFHEAIKTPSYVSYVRSYNYITWYFKNEDEDINVDMYARLGTDSFVLKASNVAPGANGTINFTGLAESTSYNVDVYCVPAGTEPKLDSEEATSTVSTTSNTTTTPRFYNVSYNSTFQVHEAQVRNMDSSAATITWDYNDSTPDLWVDSNIAASGYTQTRSTAQTTSSVRFYAKAQASGKSVSLITSIWSFV